MVYCLAMSEPLQFGKSAPLSPEQQLMQELIDGNDDAFNELYETYRERLYHVCYAYVSNSHDAWDLVQQVFLKIYKNRHHYNFAASPYTWFYRITCNTCLDHLRKRKRGREFSLSDDMPLPTDSTQDQHILHQQLSSKMALAIERLTPKQRRILIARHYDGQTLADIASLEEVAVGTIKATLHQAIEKLKGILL